MHCKSVKILKTTASARYRRYSRPPIGGDIWLSNYIITDDLEWPSRSFAHCRPFQMQFCVTNFNWCTALHSQAVIAKLLMKWLHAMPICFFQQFLLLKCKWVLTLVWNKFVPLHCVGVNARGIFMAALHSRCGYYIFALWFLLLSFFFFFLSSFFLAYSQLSETGCLPHFHTWCGLSVNLGCRCETCCMRLAVNTGCKKLPKICHLHAIAQLCQAISTQLKACIDNQKKSH